MDLLAVTHERNVAVLAPTVRRLDATVAPAFRQAALEVVAQGHTRLVLDLAAVEFLDSSGLGAMVSVLKAVGSRGTLAVCNVRGAVLSLFQLTRMDKVFLIVPDRRQAVDRLAA